jgi:hypothetical protein
VRALHLSNRSAALGLCVVAFAVYALSLRNGFAFDDVVIVTGDPRVTQFQLGAIFTKPYWSGPGFGLYRPLVTFSFAVDWLISHGNAVWFHAANALWHMLATLALFALLRAWFTVPASFAGALLFALHPVHVEAVANVVGRAELMAAAFSFTACALWAHERPRPRGLRAVLVVVLFGLALLCKESAAVLPALFVLIDAAKKRWNGFRELPRYVLSRAPEFVSVVAIVLGVILARRAFGDALTPTQLDPVMEVMPSASARVRTALQIWPHFARLFFFPRVLLADYGPQITMPLDSWTPGALAGLVLVLGLVLGGLLSLERGRGLAALGLLWLPVTLLPVANLIVPIGVLLAERTLYFPSAVLSIGVAALCAWLPEARPALARPAALAGVTVLALFALRISTRIPEWNSTDEILMAQLRDRPDTFRAEWHAARMAKRDNKRREALDHYSRAMRLWPWRERMVVEAAAYATEQRDIRFALQLVQHGVKRWPANLDLQRLLAANALDSGDTVSARAAVTAGLKLAPRDTLLNQMAAALSSQKALR